MQLPNENEIDIWAVDLRKSPIAHPETLLSSDEKERADRFRAPQHQSRFVIARASLRTILALYLAQPPQALTFSYSIHHKPSLADHPEIYFNLAHSEDLAIYAIASRGAVGIDIEKVQSSFNLSVAKRFFSEKEYADLISLPTTERVAGFYRIWSYKEAVIKAIGQGLAIPLPQFTVALQATSQHIVFQKETWYLRALNIDADFQAAVASQHRIKKISYWQLNAEGRFKSQKVEYNP